MTTIIYHRDDPDGWFSNTVCRKFLGGEVQSIGWDYGDPVPTLPPEGDIYLVDISVPELLEDERLDRRLVWIDHHKTAIEKWGFSFLRQGRGLLIEGVAACRLCWWFLRGMHGAPDWSQCQPDEPEALFLVGLRDVWKHEGTPHEQRCNHLNLALVARRDQEEIRTQLLDQREADALLDESLLETLIDEGRAIQHYADSLNREHAERGAMLRTWKGIRWLVLNSQARGSKALEDFAWPLGDAVQALMVWAVGNDGRIAVSFYHAPPSKDLDLTPIATQFGGGGHPGACGCKMTWHQMAEIIYPETT